MHFSCKIKKFYEGMQVYQHLLEDEKAIHIPFALSFTVTIATINGQLRAYLLDLENKVCQEIPDIDFDLMTDIYNIMSPKLKHDMAAFGNKTIRQILEELFGEQLDKTPAEMYNCIFDNTLLMTDYLKKIRKELDHAEPMLFEGYVCRHIREHNWDDIDDGYLKWKQRHSEITFEMLLEKQEQELQRYLERGIMRFAQKPSNNRMEEVDYDWHKGHLDCDFVDSEEYKKAYTQMMQFAIRKNGMLTIDLKKYGKYIFVNYYKFSEGQKVALFELCVILDQIRADRGQVPVRISPSAIMQNPADRGQVPVSPLVSPEERIKKCIALLMAERYGDEPLFNIQGHWQAVYRILVDKGYCRDSDFNGFDAFIHEVMPEKVNKPYKRDSVRNINKTDFNKPFDKWRYNAETSGKRIPYDRMVAVASRFKAILEENGL